MQSATPNRGLYPALPIKEWDQLVEQGKDLIDTMWPEPEDTDDPPFIDQSELARWGWKREDLTRPEYLSRHVKPLDGLVGVEGIRAFPHRSPPVQIKAVQNWIATKSIQNDRYLLAHGRRRAGPTGQSYGAIYNPFARVISWTGASDPEAMKSIPAHHLPELFDFCDIAYLEYTFNRPPNADAGPTPWPSWLHLPHILPDEISLGVVTRVLNMLGHTESIPAEGVSIPLGTRAYEALLATPPVKQFARLFIRNKRLFTNVVISSITIYESLEAISGAHAGYSAPALLIYASPVKGDVERMGEANQIHEQKMSGRQRFNWPYPLRPHIGFDGSKAVYSTPPSRLQAGVSAQGPPEAGPSTQQNPSRPSGSGGLQAFFQQNPFKGSSRNP